MTSEQLASVGLTDDQIRASFRKLLGKAPPKFDGNDGLSQASREEVYNAVCAEWYRPTEEKRP